MTQSLDVQVREPARQADSRAGPDSIRNRAQDSAKAGAGTRAVDGKTGAEPARNGNSFLAMIEKMIAGAREGADRPGMDGKSAEAERGAGGARSPGEKNARTDSANAAQSASAKKKGAISRGLTDAGELVRADPKKGTPNGKETAQTDQVSLNRMVASRSAGAPPATQGEAGESLSGTEIRTGKKGEIKILSSGGFEAPPGAFTGTVPDVARQNDKNARLANDDALEGKAEDKAVKSGARKDRNAVIGVVDERSLAPSASAKSEPGMETSVQDNGDGSADMSISFRESGSGGDRGPLYSLRGEASGAPQNFREMLSQEIRSNAAEFVRAGQIVLRDQNSGSIRLTLHPESLGNVRINLELNDRKISGKIIVSSKEAYEAFRDGMDGISKAFTESGFDTAGFDLSWSGEGEGANGDASGAASSPFYASSVPDVMSGPFSADSDTGDWFPRGSGAVNVYA